MDDEKVHIFVIEDNADISRAVDFRLKKEGFRVSAFGDGQVGLDAALQQIPHLIILDLMLPGLPGEEVCKALREHDDEKFQKIPIIMLTAKNSDADGIVGRVIGANHYMTKPFSMDDLLEQIRKILEKTGRLPSSFV